LRVEGEGRRTEDGRKNEKGDEMKNGMKNRNGMAKRLRRPNLKGLNASGAGDSMSSAAALPANGETWPAEAPKAVISGKRRNGNLARLRKEVRDRLNMMIEDGVPYAQILKKLGKDGEGISVSNLSRWKDGGHQDWLAETGVHRTTAGAAGNAKSIGEGFRCD
jgi:hypothetical protein